MFNSVPACSFTGLTYFCVIMKTSKKQSLGVKLMFIKFLLCVVIALLHVYSTARNFHEFCSHLIHNYNCLISSCHGSSFFHGSFTLPQSTISVRWSLCCGFHYVRNVRRATKFCLECGLWFVTVYMSFGHSTQLAKYRITGMIHRRKHSRISRF